MAGRVENLKPFPKGVSGNRGGRPKTKPVTEELERLLQQEAPEKKGQTWAAAIAEALVRRAPTGDVQAIAEVANRLEGGPAQAVSLEANQLDDLAERSAFVCPSKIAAGTSASRRSPTEAEVFSPGLRAWRDRLRCYQAEYSGAGVHPLSVFSRKACGGKPTANATRAPREPASKEQRNPGQQDAQKHRVPRLPRPTEIRLVGHQGQDGDNPAHCHDETVLLADAAHKHNGRQDPDEHPRRPVERSREIRRSPAITAPPMPEHL